MPKEASSQTVLALEELALNAWPALSVVVRDGWLLRRAAGYTKRANCVHMLQAGREPLADKVAWAEDIYRDAGQAAIFRLTPLTPPEVEPVLAERGYRVVEPSLVQTTDIDLAWRRHENVVLTGLDDAAWIAAYGVAANLAPIQTEALAAMLRAVALPSVLARIERDGEPVAFGMAVVERGHVGFFDMLTRPDMRRRGLGRQIMATLFAWARDQGAEKGTLQVVEANAAARALYQGFGFRPVYGYRYQVLDAGY